MTHKRNTTSMLSSPRCLAKTRAGTACQSPAVGGKARCRMHGGAKGSGAPAGNRNAWKHGRYARENLEFDHKIRELIRRGKEMLEEN